MTQLLRQERGSTSALFLFIWSAALIAIAFAVDLGRVFVIREQLRTAEEAAALAGVLQAQYMVEAQFPRERNRPIWSCWPSDPDDTEPWCEWVDNWVSISPALIRGPEAEVWPEAGQRWSQQCSGPNIRCQRQYSTSDCWIEPLSGWEAVRTASRSAFDLNMRWGDQASLVAPPAINLEKGSQVRPRQLKVGVEATLEMKTLLAGLIGVDRLPISTQGGPTTAELVRRNEASLRVWIGGVQVPSPCLLR